MYDFKTLESKLTETSEWLKKEYQGLRTGRATPTLLDGVQVDSYGARVPLNQVASISVEDARTLRIAPWDISQIKEIEKAITNANLGVGVSSDEKGVRAIFPELTSERRASLIKLAKDKLEDARQSVRAAREDAWNDIQLKEKEGEISEDEKFRHKEDLQKYIDNENKALEEIFTKKQTEIES